MLGKTHMAVGVAATLAITKPTTITELVLGSGIGALGAVISDIDSGTSESHKEADKIIATVTIILLVIGILDYFLGLGIWNKMKNNRILYQIVIALLFFVGICVYGKEQPHRSFMHSFLAMGILSAPLAFLYPMAVKYYVIGFLSHLVLDIFNYKKVRLFYPAKRGICFRLFHAKGMANDIVFITAVIVVILEVVMVAWEKFGWMVRL